jgi:muramidase (phage lysozyme)
MTRTPFQQVSKPEPIRPVAAPVDTYVRPAEPAPSDLHQLAQGLAAFDSGLSDFMASRQKKQDEADLIKGEAAFNQNNSLGWGEAVRRGLVPANASPNFVKSYKAAQGSLAGLQLNDKFDKAYMSWSGRGSNDPNAFSQFLTGFVKENIGTDDVDVLRGLNPQVETLKERAFKIFNKESEISMKNGSLGTRGALIGRDVDAANTSGLGTTKGTDYEALWSTIQERRKEAIAAGHRPEEIDAQIVETIATKAIEHNDPGILKLLDKSADGSSIALKDYPDFAKVRLQAMEKMATDGRQARVDAERIQTKADKEAEDQITVTLLRTLSKDPTKPIPEEDLQKLEKYNPRARTLIAEARRSLTSELDAEDPREIMHLQRDIAEGASKADIMAAAADGRIRSAGTLATLLDRQEKYAKGRAEGTGILTTQTTKRYSKAIAERASTAPDAKIRADIFGNVAMSDEAIEATQDFETGLMEWDDKHPGASLPEREKFINEWGQQILGRISESESVKSKDKYISLNQMATERQGPPAPQPGQMDAAEGETPGSDPISEQFYKSDKPPALDVLPQDYKSYLDEQAKKLNMPAEELNNLLWKRLKAMERPTSNDHSSIQLDQKTGSLIDKAMNMASDASGGLNLISQAEGTTKEGYNTTFGNGRYTGGPVQLTSMTIGDVKKLQAKMLADPNNTMKSSAVGKYQMLIGTLEDMQKSLGIPDTQTFDEGTQDTIAKALLKRRGYDDWRSGKITDQEFVNNIAKEWASLPKWDGNGNYPGQKARVSVSDVLSAFAEDPVRAGEQAFNAILRPGDFTPGQEVSLGAPNGPQVPVREVGGLNWDGRTMKQVNGLVIHHTGGEGSVQGVVDVLNKRGFGVQYVMDRDGTIYQTTPEGARVAHFKNAENGSGLSNDNAVGIEIIAKDDSDLTPAQVASAVRWIDAMRGKYPSIGNNVFGHGELNSHKQETEGQSVVSAWRNRHSA